MVPRRLDGNFTMNQLKMRRSLMLLIIFLLVAESESYDPEASITGLYTGPYFDPLAPRNMTAHLGDEATLPCTVRQLGDKSVSWVRMRDADILTVDRYTFVGDERFESHYSTATETWNLVIKYVQERDAGLYECQVSTEPKMSQLFSLRVVIPKVVIVPVGDRYVKAGSTVRVDCQITDVVQLPDYIFWYHEDKRVMDRRDPNLLVTVKRTGVEAITSTLTIHKVRQEQSGNFTCMPSNLHAASVTLHVLNEKHPEAMQGERNSARAIEAKFQVTLFVLLCVLICTYSFGLNEENGSRVKKRSLDLDLSSESPMVPSLSSSSSSSSSSTFSSESLPFATSFISSSRQALATIAFDPEKLRTFEVLRGLLKVNALHLIQEALIGLEDRVAKAQNQGYLRMAPGGAAAAAAAAGDFNRWATERSVAIQPLTFSRDFQNFLVEASGGGLALVHTEKETDEEEGKKSSFQINFAKNQVFSVVNVDMSRSFRRCATEARSR
nr:uncharacterized protein LOC123764426 isoform X2 [Procambarus clarkii]